MRVRFLPLVLVLGVACSVQNDAPEAAGALGGVNRASAATELPKTTELPKATELPKTTELPTAKETPKPAPARSVRILTETGERETQVTQKLSGT